MINKKFKILFVHLNYTGRKTNNKRKTSHLGIHNPHGYDNQELARLNPGASCGLPCGYRGPSSRAILCCCLKCFSRELDQKRSSQGLKPQSYKMLVSQAVASPCITKAALIKTIFMTITQFPKQIIYNRKPPTCFLTFEVMLTQLSQHSPCVPEILMMEITEEVNLRLLKSSL